MGLKGKNQTYLFALFHDRYAFATKDILFSNSFYFILSHMITPLDI